MVVQSDMLSHKNLALNEQIQPLLDEHENSDKENPRNRLLEVPVRSSSFPLNRD
jgi:hypothetical protein